MKPYLVYVFVFTLGMTRLSFCQNFSVELVPLSATVLPDTGGTISYRVTVTNLGSMLQSIDVWGKVIKPSVITGPGYGPITQLLPPGQSISWERQELIYASAQVGYYTLHVYVGSYPNTVWAQDELLFQKQILRCGVTQHWAARYNGTANYWDFGTSLAADLDGNVYVTGGSWGSATSGDYATFKYNAAGQQEWEARYNGSANGVDVANKLVLDGDGNIIVTGYSSRTETHDDYTTIKYDATGHQLWVAHYNGPGNGGDIGKSVAVDNIGNVYVTGESMGIGTMYDYATVKYNAAGQQLWEARYDGPVNGYDIPSSLVVDENGNAYVTGFSYGGPVNPDYATIKYNSFGEQQWIARYSESGYYEDLAYGLAVDRDGNVYVTGGCVQPGGYDNMDYTTIKYDSSGHQLWVATYGWVGHGDDIAHSVAVDREGNVYVTGESAFQEYYPYYSVCATVKYNNDGEQQWVARYSGPGNAFYVAYCLALDEDGNVYVTGLGSGGETYDYATNKYNNAGDLQWVALYNGIGNQYDQSRSLAIDINGNVFITGYSDCIESTPDYATIKYSSISIVNWQPLETTVLGVAVPHEFLMYLPSPNPFNAVTRLSYDLPIASQVKLQIYDNSGRLVTTLSNGFRHAGSHQVTWNATGLPSGLYFCRLQAGDYSAIQKMVLLK
jgi:uncharacterized delta-60 repeat protein